MTSLIACLVVYEEAIITLKKVPTREYIAPNTINLFPHSTNVSAFHTACSVLGAWDLKMKDTAFVLKQSPRRKTGE